MVWVRNFPRATCVGWTITVLPNKELASNTRCTLRNFPHLPDHCIEWVLPASHCSVCSCWSPETLCKDDKPVLQKMFFLKNNFVKQNGGNIVFQDQNMVVCAIFLGYSVPADLVTEFSSASTLGMQFGAEGPFVFWDWSRIKNLFNFMKGQILTFTFHCHRVRGSPKRCLNHLFFSSDAAVSYMVYTSDNEEHPCKRHVQPSNILDNWSIPAFSSSTPENRVTWK